MPSERSEQVRKYDNIRELAMDAETQSMEMPAEYMFKQVPHYDDLPDPVAEVLRLMDTHGIARNASITPCARAASNAGLPVGVGTVIRPA
ncbi:MAG: hypothetical protein RLZZ467_1406 [Gemmatimonadota bacterium]